MKSSRLLAFFALLFASNCFGMAGFNAWSDSQYNYLSTEIMKAATSNSSATPNANTKKAQTADRLIRSTASANAIGRYTISAPVTKQVKDQFIKSRSKLAPNPTGFVNFINKVNIEPVFADLMGKHGLQSHDLSDAMAGY